MHDVQQDIESQAEGALNMVISEMESRVSDLEAQYNGLVREAAKAYVRLQVAESNKGLYNSERAQGEDILGQLASDLSYLRQQAAEWARKLEAAKAELSAYRGFAQRSRRTLITASAG